MAEYSKRLQKRLSVHGPKQGYCAICRNFSNLTKDHVPPKDCGNVNDSIISDLYGNQTKSTNKSIISQGGVHFKSLCSFCNNTLLGTHYDPSLSHVVNEVTNFLKNAHSSKLILPLTHYFKYQPNKFLRSIVGHLLAAHAVDDINSADRTTPIDAILRKYFLEPDTMLPNSIQVYYWLYPYTRRVFMKHSAMSFIGSGGDVIYGHIIKFFPFGFWFVHDDQSELLKRKWNINLRSLAIASSSNIEVNSVLPIDLLPIRSRHFPETPPDNGMWLVSDNLVSSVEDRIK